MLCCVIFSLPRAGAVATVVGFVALLAHYSIGAVGTLIRSLLLVRASASASRALQKIRTATLVALHHSIAPCTVCFSLFSVYLFMTPSCCGC